MASVLKVDTLQDTSGGALSFGKILQVKATYNTDFVSQSVSANSPTNMTNMSVSITPSSTSSKILVQAQWFGEISNQTYIYNSMFGFKRGTTLIGQPTSTGSSVAGVIGIQGASINYQSDVASTGEQLFMQYLDSPSTTSATTYYTFWTCQSAATIKSGGTYNWTTSRTTSYERGTYGMIAWEIAG